MRLVSLHQGLTVALCLSATAFAQAVGDVPTPVQAPDSQQQQAPEDLRLHLDYGVFDPLLGAPPVPEYLTAGGDTNLFIVQFGYAFSDVEREAIRALGGKLHMPLPNCAVIVRMDGGAAPLSMVQGVRWVGAYQPAYRLEPEILNDLASGREMPTRKYNMVMADKHADKNVLEAKIKGMGGVVVNRHDRGLLFTAELTSQQLLQTARLDEVLWIDRWQEGGFDMNNARAIQGSNWIETQAGYDGTGIRGHVYEGVEATHTDFTFAFTNVRSSGAVSDHGTCTAGCIFGNGTSSASARGHAPGARGYFTTAYAENTGWSRNAVIDEVVNVYNCMFTTASWGDGLTTTYNSISADADDIVFDHRIIWTNSMSNQASTLVRPEAWSKNVIGVGGLFHKNNNSPGDDQWGYTGQPFGSASIGPASDGRIKPDLCNFYDSVWTTDRTGSAGYSSGNSYTGFNGTSAATPITAGLNALACEMYTDHILCNPPRVHGGTRFQNRPYANTMKALQIAGASLYAIGTGPGQATRVQQGWGYGNVRTIYDNRNNMMIIPEDAPITQGATHTYYLDVSSGQSILKVCMSYLDPAGNPAAALDRINDLTLRVWHPNGTTFYYGNNGLSASNTSSSGGSANTIDTVECVVINNPAAGQWRIDITAPTIAQDAHLATAATDATYALVAIGGTRGYNTCARDIPDNSPSTGNVNVIPFGTNAPITLSTTFANNNGGSTGGAVYFDVTADASSAAYVHGLDLNVGNVAAGTQVYIDVYRRTGTYVGNTTSSAGWSHVTMGTGVSAASGSPTTINFNSGMYILAGTTHGIAVIARNFGHDYTNGSNTYTDGTLTIDTGAASNTPWGSLIAGRTVNVDLRYQRDDSAWHNQRYQTILRCQDLGPAGKITGLSFAPSTSGKHYNRVLQIQMAHKPAGYTLSTTFATNISGGTMVLNEVDHVWQHSANTWNEIGLTSGFNYDGVSDVVVDIFLRGNHDYGTPGGFHRGDLTRLFAAGWDYTTAPTTGSIDNAGTKIRVEFQCPNLGNFGWSCGTLFADAVGSPSPGSTYTFHVHDAVPNSGAVVVLGLNQATTDLTGSGFTGCYSWNDNVASVFKVASSSGFATHNVSIPNTTAFNGLKIYGYWANFDSTMPGGLTFTNYVRSIIGQ